MLNFGSLCDLGLGKGSKRAIFSEKADRIIYKPSRFPGYLRMCFSFRVTSGILYTAICKITDSDSIVFEYPFATGNSLDRLSIILQIPRQFIQRLFFWDITKEESSRCAENIER